MTMLITGATGSIGSLLLQQLTDARTSSARPAEGLTIRALTRDPSKARLPQGVVPVAGDMLNVSAMREALQGVKTLFLLNSVATDEFTQAALTLNLAHEAGVTRIVYFSVFNGQRFSNVPHFAAKASIERLIADLGLQATILRPNCFMQNDAAYFQQVLLGPGLYPFPIGDQGVSMVDTRDIAEVAAKALLQRHQSADLLPTEVIPLVGPDALTGAGIAAIWSSLMGKTITYTGPHTTTFEANLAQHLPSWMAMDMRLMLDRFCHDGMAASADDLARMTHWLGRAPRSYAAFAAETLAQWQA
ncbi:SDR family oxidoreductase [Roseateles sp. BYS180W]|uniref:SDR family oxidoreductase n=1 Tax=Roseateles rivi TaxID=3299028 RepID=A0ABW7FRA3_9BURK